MIRDAETGDAMNGPEAENATGTMAVSESEAFAGFLIARGNCEARAMERARRVSEETGQPLEGVLLQLGLLSERALATSYAAFTRDPLVPPDALAAVDEPVLPEYLSVAFLRHARCLPLGVEGGILHLAMVNPLDAFVRRAIELATGLTVESMVAVPIELEAALQRLWPREEQEISDLRHGGDVDEDADRLKDLASEAPIIRLVNQMVSQAVETRASDIHVEPFENHLRIRYRYDGVLSEAETHSARVAAAVISRIKIMARLDIAERRLPQDGRINLAVRGHDVDIRVSTVPSMHGESIVMRILDRSAVTFDYDSLGLSASIIERLRMALDEPNGIVLVTGPTGSGKTTTLYAGLSGINTVSRKIITIEDPVEYQLEGINQLQVKPQIGLTFASLLRSILRQDPDVIMVGEIRDLETAQIAAQAALTGHLVLSTLHTNSAAAAVTRMRDMGLEDYLLSAVLRGVLAQRLVRRLCPSCRVPDPNSATLAARFDLAPKEGEGFWQPSGCPSCHHTGYRGRQAIAEFLVPTPDIVKLIFAQASDAEIERAAIAAGMETMFSAGLKACLAGETALDEVLRAARGEG